MIWKLNRYDKTSLNSRWLVESDKIKTSKTSRTEDQSVTQLQRTPKCWLQSHRRPTASTWHCFFLHCLARFLSDSRVLFCDNFMVRKGNKADNKNIKAWLIDRTGVNNQQKGCIIWLLILCFETLINYFNFRYISGWSYDHLVQRSAEAFSVLIF